MYIYIYIYIYIFIYIPACHDGVLRMFFFLIFFFVFIYGNKISLPTFASAAS